MQHLAPRRNSELPNGHLVALASDPYCNFSREYGAGGQGVVFTATIASGLVGAFYLKAHHP